jgi:hypothetical protein
VNEVTWLELVHWYLITLIEVKKNGNLNGLKLEDNKRLIRCLQGNGRVLFGATTIIVAVENDVQI